MQAAFGDRRVLPYLLVTPAVAILVTLLVLPLLVMGAYSLYRFVDTGIEVPAVQFGNWLDLLHDRYYHAAMWNTARISLWVTAICVVAGYVPAHVIATCETRWRAPLLLLLILPFWISFVIRTLSWIHVLGAHGFINSALLALGVIDKPLELLYGEPSVVLGLVHVCLPFAILNTYVAIDGIDRNLIPVARTLGATPLQAFVAITLPLSMPGVATGALLVFVLTAGSYVTPLVLGGPNDFMFGNVIYGAVLSQLNWPLAATLAIALTFVLGLLLVVYNRFFGLERLTRGLS